MSFRDGESRKSRDDDSPISQASCVDPQSKEVRMFAFLMLLLILAVFGGLGFAFHFLWLVLIAALLLWAIGFFVGSIGAGFGQGRWYGRR
jgi:fatty-acid desaturase